MQWAKQKQPGFTIVELLIVIVVIAILAAITIVAYNGIQNRANDTVVQSELKALANKNELFFVDNSRYRSMSELNDFNFKATKNAYAIAPATSPNLTYCTNTAATRYVLLALTKSGKAYYTATGDASVKELPVAWSTVNSGTNCTAIDSQATSNYNGYASNDTTTGPWRSWVGGN